jgi:hypothetical protein
MPKSLARVKTLSYPRADCFPRFSKTFFSSPQAVQTSTHHISRSAPRSARLGSESDHSHDSLLSTIHRVAQLRQPDKATFQTFARLKPGLHRALVLESLTSVCGTPTPSLPRFSSFCGVAPGAQHHKQDGEQRDSTEGHHKRTATANLITR